MNGNFAEFGYAGPLDLEKITVRISSIISVQKPTNGTGCVIQVPDGQYEVTEDYNSVLAKIGVFDGYEEY